MAAAADPGAAERAITTPLAASGLFDEEPVSERAPVSGPVSQRITAAPLSSAAAAVSVPSPSVSNPAISSKPMASISSGNIAAVAAPQSVRALPALATGAATRSDAKKSSLGLIIGGLFAAGVIAAGAFLFVQQNRAKAPTGVSVAAVTPAVPVPVVAAAPTEPPVVVAQNDSPPVNMGADVADPSDLQAPTLAAHGKVGGGKPSMKAVAKPSAPGAAAAPATDVDPSLVAKNLPPSPAGEDGTLADRMKQAAGTTPAAGNDPQAATGPQFEPGSVPQRPSQGAVTGALGAALPAARLCLPADAAISSATITFGSTGTVTSVTVTGSAAGKPAEGCIKGALSRAKVPPFAQPAYTAKVNVRPN